MPRRRAEHADTDGDSDVDSSDLWYYNAFDERWRKLATFRGSDTAPKEGGMVKSCVPGIP